MLEFASIVPQKTPRRRRAVKPKDLAQIAASLEKSLEDERRLATAIVTLQAEVDTVSKLFKSSPGHRKVDRKP